MFKKTADEKSVKWAHGETSAVAELEGCRAEVFFENESCDALRPAHSWEVFGSSKFAFDNGVDAMRDAISKAENALMRCQTYEEGLHKEVEIEDLWIFGNDATTGDTDEYSNFAKDFICYVRKGPYTMYSWFVRDSKTSERVDHGAAGRRDDAFHYALDARKKLREPASAQLPEIDWESAPEDAVCHANDKSGRGCFCNTLDIEPEEDGKAWFFSKEDYRKQTWSEVETHSCFYQGVNILPLDGDDWKQTLQVRPERKVESLPTRETSEIKLDWLYFCERGTSGYKAYHDEFRVTALDEGCEIVDFSDYRSYRVTRGTRGEDNKPQSSLLEVSKNVALELLSAIIFGREEDKFNG